MFPKLFHVLVSREKWISTCSGVNWERGNIITPRTAIHSWLINEKSHSKGYDIGCKWWPKFHYVTKYQKYDKFLFPFFLFSFLYFSFLFIFLLFFYFFSFPFLFFSFYFPFFLFPFFLKKAKKSKSDYNQK